ncbi:MAG: hypothetical protein EOP81_10950 [Variovorax sp.]|nr:MAG: hypothetical protein EOP81_10950 [Variovorax sp.]
MNDRDTAIQPRTDAGIATAVEGVVVLDGPDGVAVTMTADAATRTANSLHAAADEARRNPPQAVAPHDPPSPGSP